LNAAKEIWLGHHRTGGRFYLRANEIAPGINILGAGAGTVAAVIAAALSESGFRTLVLDFNGNLARLLAGRFETSSQGEFLYDSQRMEEKSSLHAELAASAYTISLNLNFEQEGFLNSAIQYIGLEQGVASPASLMDRLVATGEFRGHTSDELRGKLGALRSLNLTGETGIVRAMIERNSVANFAEAESYQAAEVASMLLMAKVMALGASEVRLPDAIVLNESNRIFANLPLTRHTNRLLTALLSSPMAKVFASEVTYGLDHHFLDTSPVRITSSSLWNDSQRGRSSFGGLYQSRQLGRTSPLQTSSLLLTPNMYAIQDSAHGFEGTFIPRSLPPLYSESPAPSGGKQDDSRLVKAILETLAAYDHATRGSVVGFLSSEFLPEEIQKAIDGLQAEGCLAVVGKDVRTDSPLQTFRLTEKGYGLLRSLK
jgi:hypothetical protein